MNAFARRVVRVSTLLSALSIGTAAVAEDPATVYTSEGQKFRVEVLADRDQVIWGFDFLPSGEILLTERTGQLVRLDPKTGRSTPITGVPKVFSKGQGGLLDLRLHPEFAKNSWVYFTYAKPVGDDLATTALARGKLGKPKDAKLDNVQDLFTGIEANDNTIHFGSRIAFDGKGHVFITMGDRDQRHRAQELGFHQGKILRLNEDGTVPRDNPFVGKPGAKPEIWSYGHRNPQGLAMRPGTSELWSAEFGPRGGDEINLVEKGANYGWPVVTHGREYWGPKIGEGTSKPGMKQPIEHWTPSISPSGMDFYTGKAFPKWSGHLFLANLSSRHLRRLVLNGGKVTQQEALLEDLELRIRTVRSAPDGFLYFSTDDGKLARLVPSK